MDRNCDITKLNEYIDTLSNDDKLNKFKKEFLGYIKTTTNIKGKIYIIQKFLSFLKIFEIPNDVLYCIQPEMELCELKTQKFIDLFLTKIKDNIGNQQKQNIKIYLKNTKYVNMSLMEKLVIYVILNDMINDDEVYIDTSKKDDIIRSFNELLSKCKYKSHKGFI
jgi:hypothetical protein